MYRPIAALALLVAAPQASAQSAGPTLSDAIAAPDRPSADRERDAARKPAELLAFARLTPGQKVGDFISGSGYWARIMARATGPRGTIYAYQPAEFVKCPATPEAAPAGYPNIVALCGALGEVRFPEPLDMILTVQNWHDLHLKSSPDGLGATIAKRLHDALKPGGTLVVVDHVANPQPIPFAVAATLHRSDTASLRQEIERAGFAFAGESRLYADPADPHTASVFDPAIRGRTDQLAYRFVRR